MKHIIRIFYNFIFNYSPTHYSQLLLLDSPRKEGCLQVIVSWVSPNPAVFSILSAWFPCFFFLPLLPPLSDHSLSFYPISVSTFYFKCKDSESLCPRPLCFTHSLIYSVSSSPSTVLGSRDTLPNRWTGTDPSNLLV